MNIQISVFLEIWNFQKYRNFEIQKYCNYVCLQADIYVCMHAGMYLCNETYMRGSTLSPSQLCSQTHLNRSLGVVVLGGSTPLVSFICIWIVFTGTNTHHLWVVSTDKKKKKKKKKKNQKEAIAKYLELNSWMVLKEGKC